MAIRSSGSALSTRRSLSLFGAAVVGLMLIASGFGSSGRRSASLPDATKSTVIASPAVQVEDSTHSVTVTVTLLDASGSPVAGKQVSLKSVFGGTAAAPKASDGSGVVTFSVRELVVRSDTYQATDTTDGIVLRHETTVRWVSATAADPGKSTAVVTPGAKPAPGKLAQVSVKLTVENGVGDPLQGVRVGIATTSIHMLPGSDSTTDGSGSATLELAGPPGQSLPVTITAGYYTSGAHKGDPFPVLHPTIAFQATAVAGAASARTSTVEVSPSSVPADGASVGTVTVTLNDAAGIPVPGKVIHLALGAGTRAATILPPKQATHPDGTATFTVKATTPGIVRLTASDVSDAFVLADTATVTFKTPAPVSKATADATKSTVVASPAVQVEDGTHSVTVTVTLLDSSGSPVEGKKVTLKSVFGGVEAAAPKTSDSSGIATFSLRALVPRSDTYQATDTTDSVVLRHETTVRWVSATAADPGKSTALVTPGAPPAAGMLAKVSVKLTVENGVGDPLQGMRVGIATTNVHVLPGSDTTTKSNGTATLQLAGPPGQSVPVTITAGQYTSGGQKGKAFPVLHPTIAFQAAAGGSTGVKTGGKGWAATAIAYADKVGQRYAFLCPAGGTRAEIWGTTTYTDDSSVCTAAVNDGLITVAQGGTVTIEMRPGLSAYTGSNHNGTSSESYGHWDASFVFIGTPTHRSNVGFGGADWGASAVDFRGKNSQEFLYSCPAKGSIADVYGTDLYTDDSSVCSAAVHAGLITVAAGGDVTIQIRPGAASYTGSTRHGITSQDYDAWSGSYVFAAG